MQKILYSKEEIKMHVKEVFFEKYFIITLKAN